MIVFFRNIPGDTQKSELAKFIAPVIKGGLFRTKGEIKKINIMALRDKHINLMEYHALVTIEPESQALRAIKKLHGQPFRGRRIIVRKYIVRNWRNDKRLSSQGKALAPEIKERRKVHCRRRNLEIIDDITPTYTSHESFHRIF